MKVYAMNISSINPDDKKWYQYLSEQRIEKMNRLKKNDKKAQSIGVELLLNYAINHDIRKSVSYNTDMNGKLYLTDGRNYVNLSHSGDYAVCAVHDKPIGIDIQQICECDMKLSERFFTAEEADMIDRAKNREAAFFEIWTKKESLVKAVGCGLRIPLNSFSVLNDTVEYDGSLYRFKEYRVKSPNYKLFSCSLD